MGSEQAAVRQTGAVGTIKIPQAVNNKIKISKESDVRNEASVHFVNGTRGKVKLLIPYGGFVFYPPDKNSARDTRVDIDPGDTCILQVLQDPKPGMYPFAAYCDAIGDFAEGGSAPVIIVH